MDVGDVIAERFVLDRLARVGGMGAIYAATDRSTGSRVALKLLRLAAGKHQARFVREARILERLVHPAIVRHVGHGVSQEGAWLAMEWLEGEDLKRRASRAPLGVSDVLVCVRRVAEALAFAHANGIVHRDVKPSNVFLRAGDPRDALLLDFGVARLEDLDEDRTRTGVVLGTPGFMAPEQVRAQTTVDARADVFSLGCVLFALLAGRAPFDSDEAIAAMAKVLFEEAPRLRDARPDLPLALDDLVARMLAKDPSLRPSDGAAALEELSALGDIDGPPPSFAQHRDGTPIYLRPRELVCVVLVGHETDAALEQDGQTLCDGDAAALARIASEHGARLDALGGRGMLLTLEGTGVAGDLAVRGARCALALRRAMPALPVAVATGLGDRTARAPLSAMLERVVALTRLARDHDAPIVDEVTAALLERRFDVQPIGGAFRVRGERSRVDASRTLLGRETPFVGRERELALLGAIVDECVAEASPRAAIVTGEDGVGKSRLRFELVRAFRERSPAFVLVRGDPMRAGSAFALVAEALRAILDLREGAADDDTRGLLRARVAQRVGERHADRVARFVGEVVAMPFPDDDDALRAARRDARLMGDQIARACEDLLGGEVARRPLALVIEDAHWGDLPSMRLFDRALQSVRGPLFVLAVGRSELHARFPRLFGERATTELRLSSLSRAASRALVRALLERTEETTVERIVALAEGNAFFLEELVRAASSGALPAVPGSVMVMVQSRIDALPRVMKDALCAASVFGQVFWEGGVRAILEIDPRGALEELRRRELVARRVDTRFADEDELIFRSELVRRAAYELLADDDRARAHQRAADWLLAIGESDPVVLASHLERGGDRARAVRWWTEAAAQALEGNDVESAIARADRGIECGAGGLARASLDSIAAEAHRWRGEFLECEARAERAAAAAPPGSIAWLRGAGEAIGAAVRLGRVARARELARAIEEAFADPALEGSEIAFRAAVALAAAGAIDAARSLVSAAERRIGSDRLRDATRSVAHAFLALYDGGDLAAYVARCGDARRAYEAIGDVRNACTQAINEGYGHLRLGDHARAARILSDALESATRNALPNLRAAAEHNLGLVFEREGDLSRAEALQRSALAGFLAQGDARLAAGARAYLAAVLAARGDFESAFLEAEQAARTVPEGSPVHLHALALLADVERRRGDPARALARAQQALATLERSGALEAQAFIRLSLAEAHLAKGDRAAARRVLEAAHEVVRRLAAGIGDDAARRGFLERVPEHARIARLLAETG